MVIGLFATIYKLLPTTHLAWRDALLGAAVTACLFIVGRYTIGLYLGNSTPASAFGATGSLTVLLLWVYYSTSIFFLGAKVTKLFIAPPAPGAPSRATATSDTRRGHVSRDRSAEV